MATAPARTRLRRATKKLRPPPIGVLRRAGVLEAQAVAAALGAVPRLVGRGASLGLVSHINARAVGAKPAVIDRQGTLTWADLDARANRLARALRRRGIRPGDTVATVLRNGREIVETVLATQKIGAVTAPLNTWAKPNELGAAIESAAPHLVIHDGRHAEGLPDGQDLELLRVAEAAAERDSSYEAALSKERGNPLAPVTFRRAHPRVVIHTSGTTGKPKGARRGAGRSDARAFLDLLSVVPLHRSDVIFCPAPLFHSFGMLTVTLSTLLGATLVLPDSFDPERSLEWMARHRATAGAFVPVMLHRIASLPEEQRDHDLSLVRIVLASGSAIPPALRERVTGIFGPALYDMYGSTETGLVSVATPEIVAERPDSVGRILPGVDLAVFGGDGSRLPLGETGRLFILSEGAFEGYTGQEQVEEIDGYMSIGDAGRIDEGDYLYVEGRSDDMVVVGGENVYPIEVEEAIMRVGGVREVSVAGLRDEEYGHSLVAFVVGDVGEQDVIEACRSSLASYKVPRRVELLDELPRTATGKVLTRELVARFEKE